MKKVPKKFTTKKKDSVPAFAKASAGKHKSPSISRVIPVNLRANWQVVFVSFLSGVLLMTIGITSVRLWENSNELMRLQAMHERLARDEQYWASIVQKYPDYKDAYMQLAIAAYRLGETEKARESIQKVLQFDPNDERAEAFAKRIGS